MPKQKKKASSIIHNPVNINTQVEEPEQIEKRANAIMRCIEIVDRRIAYNNSLMEYYRNSDESELRNHLAQSNMFGAGSDLQFIKNHVIEGIGGDLENLKTMRDLLVQALIKDDHFVTLSLAFAVHDKRTIEAFNMKSNLENYNQQVSTITQTRRYGLISQDSANAQLQKAERYKIYIETHSEQQHYDALYEILDNEVYTKLERQFLKYFLQQKIFITDSGLPKAEYGISKQFKTFYAKNLKHKERVSAEIDARHKLHPRLTDSPVAKNRPHNQSVSLEEQDTQASEETCNVSLDKFIRTYVEIYFMKERLDKINAEHAEYIKTELAWLEEQDRLALASQAQELVLQAERAAAEEAKEIEKAKIAEEKCRQEKIKRADELARAKKLFEFESLRKKMEQDVRKVQKHARHVAAVRSTIQESVSDITVADTHFNHSRYIVSIAQVEKAAAILAELFDASTITFKLNKAEKLMSDLGGTWKSSSGGSHFEIQFKQTVVQSINGGATEHKPSTAGGFASKNTLFGYNLYLFASTINQVLPQNWQDIVKKSYNFSVHTKWHRSTPT